MVFIDRLTTNTLYLTLTEKVTLTAPDYLIKFVCVSTKDERYAWCSDTSSYPNRYNELSLVETNSPTSGTNQVKLDTYGAWDYFVYEYTGAAPTDETGLIEVEQGQVTVNHTATTLQSYNGYQSTYIKYDG
jgi:hypothetical protein